MATKNAIMAISASQALAISKSEGVKFPRKNNAVVRLGNVTLKRLPEMFRKKGKNTKSYRLAAKNHKDLERFFKITETNGRSAVIVYRNQE